MVQKYVYRGVEWIDLDSPTYEEVATVARERNLNRVLAEELTKPSLKPKVDLYRDHLYLVLHFPAIRQSHTGPSNQEIDFIIGKDFIITTHYDTVDPLHEFSKIFEVNAILERSDFGEHAGYIFYYMLKHIYKGTENELESIKEKLETIEAGIFSGKERQMVERISHLGRDILAIKGALRPHQQILDSLTLAAVKFFGKDFEYPMHSITNEYFRINNEIAHASELMNELRETNNTLVSTHQNEIMQQLSVIAFIALPIGLVLTLFQIDTVSKPIVGTEGDFWIILSTVVAMALLLYSFAKAKKWL
ncbi:MAG TPA: CorA family divalent cation transporter [Candidatus Paceibacterota bacterium]